ncbi:MAG: histidine phosphatase family protein [Rhodopirellula sp.]|nr:histidine phosphatase family protein [Rhodopirellula sp.]
MIVYCVRHGESTYNAENRVQGQSDVPLSELGRRQSEAVASELAMRPIGALYSSPLRRAMETAEPIAGRLGLRIRSDARLKEVDVGVFQDYLRTELSELFPEELARWESSDPDYAVPGGESRSDLAGRGIAAMNEIAHGDEPEVVVVAHGRLLVETLRRLIGSAPDGIPPSLRNGSITTVESHREGRWELRSVDAVEHLRGVGLAGAGDL